MLEKIRPNVEKRFVARALFSLMRHSIKKQQRNIDDIVNREKLIMKPGKLQCME